MRNDTILILDDVRSISDVLTINRMNVFGDTVKLVKSYREFCDWVTSNGVPAFVSFDHDLADVREPGDGALIVVASDWTKEKTGVDCAAFLIEYCHAEGERFPVYNVHSANPVGAANIRGLIESALRSGYIR